MKKRTLIILMLIAPLMLMAQNNRRSAIPQQLNKLMLTESMITRFYVDTVNEAKVVEAGIKAMLKELDPHSTYSDPKEVKSIMESLQGNFDGIGIQFNIVDDTLVVIQPTLNGPSEKLGVLPGDRIISVNDTTIAGVKMDRYDIMRRLRGKKGTQVHIEVIRRGVNRPIPFDIIRDKIATSTVDAAYMLDKKRGYIRISSFGQQTHREFAEKLDSLKQLGMDDLVLDLQSNGGGLLQASVDIANEFLNKNELIVYTQGRVFPRYDYIAKGGGRFTKGRLVVLVDENTASAAEILSGAIQDWDRGIIVGRRSFGKGLVQRPLDLPDGSMIRLTIARYYTPSGRNIQKPYGDSIQYRDDLMQRYNRGELSSADSIHFPDSLKVQTKRLNRTVYGGGGIMPDYFVSLDTTKYTKYHRDLARKGTIIQTTLRYLDDKRSEMKQKYPTFEDYRKKFEVDEELLARLRKQAERDSVKLKDEEEYQKSLPQIRRQIKALLARDLWNMNEYFQIFNEDDDAVKKAMELIKERNTDALLTKKK
jgi:carboxyl-terminal processing protease